MICLHSRYYLERLPVGYCSNSVKNCTKVPNFTIREGTVKLDKKLANVSSCYSYHGGQKTLLKEKKTSRNFD